MYIRTSIFVYVLYAYKTTYIYIYIHTYTHNNSTTNTQLYTYVSPRLYIHAQWGPHGKTPPPVVMLSKYSSYV